MHWYTGLPLGERPRIALMANDALGNYALCTLLAQGFRAQWPECTLDFYGGERTAELESASCPSLFDWRTSLHGQPFRSVLKEAGTRGPYSLISNIEAGNANKALAAALANEETYVSGPCLSPDSRGDWDYPSDSRGDLWRDKEWLSSEITQKYPFLKTGFIGEIFYKLNYLPLYHDGWSGDIPKYRFTCEPSGEMPEVLISTGASIPSKLWSVAKWSELLGRLEIKPGLLGAPPKRQREFYHSVDDEQSLVDDGLVHDFRGKLSLPQVVDALSKAKLVVTIDNGILHFAAANDVPTVGLYRGGFERLWAPPNPNLTTLSGEVAEISVDDVLDAARLLRG